MRVSNVDFFRGFPKARSKAELYFYFLRGEVCNYSHTRGDKPYKKLKVLADNYKKSMSVKDRQALLYHEREMVYEELNAADTTVARNLWDLMNLSFFREKDPVKKAKTLTRFNVEAILGLESLRAPFDLPPSLDKFKKIEKFEKQINAQADFAMKPEILSMIQKIKGILLEKISEYKLAFPMKKKIDIYNPEQLKTLLVTQKSSEHPEIKTLVTRLLKENTENSEIKRLAIWGAGKFRNDENFEIVKEIALNNADYGYREREYAIHSTALYLKDKPEEVRAVMKTISEENSVFAKLGKILNNKVNGILYERSAILEELKNNKEFTAFFQEMKKCRHYSERIEHKLLNAQTDFCLEYPHGIRVSDSVDSFISKNPDYIGTRDFSYWGTFADGKPGKFHDTIEEVFFSHHYDIEIPLYKLTDASGYNIIAKMIGKYLYKTKPKAQEIADAAHKNLKGEFLDGVPCGKEEYFAQGVEAYFSPYKPHSKLLTSENTLYKLMDKDQFLYYRLKSLFD